MESNNNQGEGNGHEQPPGLPPHVFQLFEDGQRVPQHQQDQDQDQDQAAMNTTFAVNPVNQDFGNLGHNLGPQTNAIGFAGAGGIGQHPSSLATMISGNQPLNFNNTDVPPVAFAQGPSGTSHLLSLRQLMDNGAGVPNILQQGQQPDQQPMLPAPMGNQGNHQQGGAAWQPGQVSQATGNFQSRNLAPHNEVPDAPASIQQAAGEQPSLKRPAGNGSADEERNTKTQSPAPMSISELLDRDLITDVAGLKKKETDEILLWGRRKDMKWSEIHKRFNFECAESTLRGQYRGLVKSRPPKVPKFTERDLELLREAVEHIAGGPVDDVDNTKEIKALWDKVQKYILKHGGTTQAGPSTLKNRYKALISGDWRAGEFRKQRKAKRDQQASENGNAQGSQEQVSDGSVEQEEPAAESSIRENDAGNLERNGLQWNHAEYDEYDVEWEDGADFEDDDEGEDEED